MSNLYKLYKKASLKMRHLQTLGTIFKLKLHIKHSKVALGRVEQAHIFKENKIKPQDITEIRRAQRLGEELRKEDLCDRHNIAASQEHDTPQSLRSQQCYCQSDDKVCRNTRRTVPTYS